VHLPYRRTISSDSPNTLNIETSVPSSVTALMCRMEIAAVVILIWLLFIQIIVWVWRSGEQQRAGRLSSMAIMFLERWLEGETVTG
ncbi:hypothetical protein PanWU01x14_283500, partial [Parasponia andersonii]